jgi:hypothetical protein
MTLLEPHPHMIGKFGLSMYLPSSVTSIDVPDGLLEPATAYNWEVLAIERSGHQTSPPARSRPGRDRVGVSASSQRGDLESRAWRNCYSGRSQRAPCSSLNSR